MRSSSLCWQGSLARRDELRRIVAAPYFAAAGYRRLQCVSRYCSVEKSSVVLTSLCLRYLLLLRAFAMSCQVLALVVAHFLFDIPLPWVPIVAVVLTMAALTVRSWRMVSSGRAISEIVVLRQLFLDIAALAILLYYTGGSWNPFVSLFLLPITVAAATLRAAYTWLLVLISAACYTLLMFFHQNTLHWGHGDAHFALHLWGMWLGFLLSAGIVAYFVARIGATLRAHDRELASARQVMALGAMAAGAAHELGTPLATMAVVTREMELEGNASALTENLSVLRAQLDRCKQIVGRIASHAGQSKAESGAAATVEHYLADVLTEWQSLRPEAQVSTSLSGTQPPPRIVADRTLTQALMNVLNNAADASAANIEIDAHWNDSELRLRVGDRGTGLPGDFAEQLGEAFVSSKTNGMGLGLYLARTTLSRFGGELRLSNRPDGTGAQANIRLPLAGLLA
jgi:two-component system sensor histidine kinase RegB